LVRVCFCHQLLQLNVQLLQLHINLGRRLSFVLLSGLQSFKSRHFIYTQLHHCFDENWEGAKSALGLLRNIQLLQVHLCSGRRRILRNLCSALRRSESVLRTNFIRLLNQVKISFPLFCPSTFSAKCSASANRTSAAGAALLLYYYGAYELIRANILSTVNFGAVSTSSGIWPKQGQA